MTSRPLQRFVLLISLALSFAIATPDAVADDGLEARKHLVYGEGLGKLGLYGVGYEYAARSWLTVGGAASMWRASTATVVAGSAYLGVGRKISGPHRWFAQAGPAVVRQSEPAVPGFDGLAATGVGGQLTAGYELRGDRFLFRSHIVVTVGRGGVAPWGGVSFGVRL